MFTLEWVLASNPIQSLRVFYPWTEKLNSQIPRLSNNAFFPQTVLCRLSFLSDPSWMLLSFIIPNKRLASMFGRVIQNTLHMSNWQQSFPSSTGWFLLFTITSSSQTSSISFGSTFSRSCRSVFILLQQINLAAFRTEVMRACSKRNNAIVWQQILILIK